MTLEPSHYEEVVGAPERIEEPAAAEAPPPIGVPSREYRAMITFIVGGAFLLVALFLLGSAFSLSALPLTSVVVGIVALFATATGLSNSRPWAIAVATPILWLIVIVGTLEFVAALMNNGINIPVGGILAIWALRAPLRGAAGPWGAPGTLAFLGVLLSDILPLLGPAF